MEKILAHKIELDPNNVQETYFKKGCGTDRFVCAWGFRRVFEPFTPMK